MKPVYYNDNDAYCVAWLRNLIAAGHLPAGEVDDRPIQDVRADDLGRFGQCHFFAGIGGWALALRLARWTDYRAVWTGSCPCQPFSAAGKGLGVADERHLWPEFFRLIAECRPATVLGEQVASKAGRQWLAGVCADLESVGYAAAGADLCAASAGAPHIRQRLYWVADAPTGGQRIDGSASRDAGHAEQHVEASRLVGVDQPGSQGWGERLVECSHQWPSGQANLTVLCNDGKARRFEPGAFPLAHGVQNRVGRLRGYGNAIVPQVAQAFIECVMECRP